MSQSIGAILPVQPALPSETPHGGHGHGHSAKQLSAYQQALAHQPSRTNHSAATSSPTHLTHAEKTDKDGEGQRGDAHEHGASHGSSANRSADEDNSPAAIVSISAAARAGIVHEATDAQ